MRDGEDEIGRHRKVPRRVAALQLVEGYRLDRDALAQRIRHGAGIAGSRLREDPHKHDMPCPSPALAGGQARHDQAGEIAAAEPHGEPLVDERVDPSMEIEQPAIRDLRRRPARHEGAGAGPSLDQPHRFEVPVHLRDRHRRDPELLGQFAHGRQAIAGPQLAIDDPEFQQATQLRTQRDGQVPVNGQVEGSQQHLFWTCSTVGPWPEGCSPGDRGREPIRTVASSLKIEQNS